MPVLACGVDIGSTNLKVVLLDREGRTVWSRAVPTPRVEDGGGSVATDANRLLAAVEAMVVEGWRATGDGVPLAAIACAGVGEDGVGLSADLGPTGPALAWFDGRARAEAEELAGHPSADARIGLAVGADRTLAKWLWLTRHDPGAIARAEAGCAALTDYPSIRWTGRPFMSRSLAARTAAYDVFDRSWVAGLLAASGAPALPEVLDAGTVVGPVRHGLLRASGAASAETVVVAGGHDHPIAAAAIRRGDPAARVDSLGTANVVYGEIDRPLSPRRHPPLAFSVPVRPGPGLACLGVVALAERLGSDGGTEPVLARMLGAERLPGRPLPADPRDAVDVLRARIEAATFEARDAFRAMDDLGVPRGRLYATGGWSRSRALVQVRASIFGVPVKVIDEPELVALSAALIAAGAAGHDIPFEARRRTRRVGPDPAWARLYAAVTAEDVLSRSAALRRER
jgi:xylulokinase